MSMQDIKEQDTKKQDTEKQDTEKQDTKKQDTEKQNEDIQREAGKDGNKNGNEFQRGMFYGVIIAVLVIVGGMRLYVGLSGNRVVIGNERRPYVSRVDFLDNETVAKVEELSDYIDANFFEEYDEQNIRNGIYSGLLSGLKDPYSVYYSAEEYESMKSSTDGVFCGIGVGLIQDAQTKEIRVVKVYDDTPAQAAGIKKDDRIVLVGDAEASKEDLTELVSRIRGQKDTMVHLKLYRPSEKKTYEVDVERKDIEIPSVKSNMLDDATGYIAISEFQANTPQQFTKHFNKLEKKGMKALVIDLRENPGGLLDAVISILDDLLPEGILVYTEDKNGKRRDYTSGEGGKEIPMVVLVNANSASASEIFAGAMKDRKAATILGTKTFGKGIVQTIFGLKDGDAVKLTTAKYFTPNGNDIHGKGIEPDITLEYKFTGPEDAGYEQKYDNQLMKAKELLEKE